MGNYPARNRTSSTGNSVATKEELLTGVGLPCLSIEDHPWSVRSGRLRHDAPAASRLSARSRREWGTVLPAPAGAAGEGEVAGHTRSEAGVRTESVDDVAATRGNHRHARDTFATHSRGCREHSRRIPHGFQTE